jgi:DNA polymerase-3 subunit delta'
MQLQNVLKSGRIPHAYLFHGPEGVGKDAMAIELARVLHCAAGKTEACGVCDPCRQLATLQHPDVHFVTALPVGKDEDKGDGPLDKLTPKAARHSDRGCWRRKGPVPAHHDPARRGSRSAASGKSGAKHRSASAEQEALFILSHAEMLTDVAKLLRCEDARRAPPHCILILTTPNREAARNHHLQMPAGAV